MFKTYCGDLMGLKTNKNYINFIWDVKHCKILFSVTKKGDAACCHFSSDKRGLRYIKIAIKLFCKFCFDSFEWCRKVVAMVNIPSVERIMSKCGLENVFKNDKASVWEMVRTCHL